MMIENNPEQRELVRVLGYLPTLCGYDVKKVLRESGVEDHAVSEIRLRLGRRTAVRADGRSILCNYIMSMDDIRATVRMLCSGAVYAYQNTIKNGYIPMQGGGRAGVVGVISDGNTSIAPETVSAINIRIPHHIRGVCAAVYDLFINNGDGIIVYSAPTVGKTTLLRDLAIELSRGNKPYNVAMIDTRRELDNGHIPDDCMIDTYSGYPKSLGIEIAARTMSSDVIICDEIGYEEVEAMRYTVISSIPVIASAHARSLDELRKRPDVAMLVASGVFGYAVGLVRSGTKRSFEYVIDRLR
jgi:stage III sporulation protein AA